MIDVARLAGVSQQSVSRVVNGKPNVDPALRLRVERAIEQLGYQRNSAARALATSRSMNLGVLSLGLSLFGPSEALFGIAQEADRNGYETSLVPVERADRATMSAAARRLLAGAVDGIVLLTSTQTAVDALSSLDVNVPVVLFGPGTPGDESIITVDEEAGARAATEHLLELGHATVHHVSGMSGWLADAARLRGWSRTLSEAGRVVPPPFASDWTTASGYQAGLRIAEDPSVTAVFASNDAVALGVIKALADRGIRVPDDVSVVGFDDVPQAAFFQPALTTVRVDFSEVGRACVRRILAVLDSDEDTNGVPARPELVVRGSTTVPRQR
jgi:DNA-binding LacI/PurR family transcriptional regulator